MNRIVEPGNPLADRASVARTPTRWSVQPVILASASLAPLSRERGSSGWCGDCGDCRERQAGRVPDDETLLDVTLSRLDEALGVAALDLPPPARRSMATPLVVCDAALRHIGERLAQSGQPARLLLEPQPRGSAPALTVAAHAARAAAEPGDDPLLVVLPAAYPIPDETAFGEALAEAFVHASRGAIVALAERPRHAATRYGYIRTGIALGARGARKIERFVAQPDAELAERFVASGDYWWSSGAFVVRASTWLSAIALCRPVIAACCALAFERATPERGGALHLAPDAFATCASDSIDAAVLERIASDPRLIGVSVPFGAAASTDRAARARLDQAVNDDAGNVARGRVYFDDARDNFAYAEGRLVACVGVRGVVVVETADAVLVAAKDRVQDVKAVLGRLSAQREPRTRARRRIARVWGYEEVLERDDRCQVKRIVVAPGGRLSLDVRRHRAGHWTVIGGSALVTRGAERFVLTQNQSTMLACGVAYRLENPGDTPLEVIEVQAGVAQREDERRR